MKVGDARADALVHTYLGQPQLGAELGRSQLTSASNTHRIEVSDTVWRSRRTRGTYSIRARVWRRNAWRTRRRDTAYTRAPAGCECTCVSMLSSCTRRARVLTRWLRHSLCLRGQRSAPAYSLERATTAYECVYRGFTRCGHTAYDARMRAQEEIDVSRLHDLCVDH